MNPNPNLVTANGTATITLPPSGAHPQVSVTKGEKVDIKPNKKESKHKVGR